VNRVVEKENIKQKSRKQAGNDESSASLWPFRKEFFQGSAGLEERFRSHGVSEGLYFLLHEIVSKEKSCDAARF
jgi:hypothetical protein